MISARFVDQEEVIGLPIPAGRSILGSSTSARLVIDLVAAVVDGDEAGHRRLRRDAVARPGASVDALTALAGYLSGLADGERPLQPLHLIAAHSELAAIENEILDTERTTR